MLYSLHDLHLVLDLLIQYPILDESPFLKLFGCIGVAIILRCHLVDHSKGPFANAAYPVVLAGPVPFSAHLGVPLLGRRSAVQRHGVRGDSIDHRVRWLPENVRRSIVLRNACLGLQTVAGKVLVDFCSVCALVVVVAAGDAHPESQVPDLLV